MFEYAPAPESRAIVDIKAACILQVGAAAVAATTEAAAE